MLSQNPSPKSIFLIGRNILTRTSSLQKSSFISYGPSRWILKKEEFESFPQYKIFKENIKNEERDSRLYKFPNFSSKISPPCFMNTGIKSQLVNNDDQVSLDPRQDLPSITAPAADRLASLLLKKFGPSWSSEAVVYMTVTASGCAGFSYNFKLTKREELPKDVFMVDNASNIHSSPSIGLACDINSISLLKGAEIDFVDGDMKSEIIVNNPNAKKSCSCGKSFAV